GRVQIIHQNKLQCTRIQVLAPNGVRVHSSFCIVAAFYMCRSAFYEGLSFLLNFFVANRNSDLQCSVASCPLEKITIAMPVRKISEFPDTRIFFINRMLNLI